MIFNRNNGDKEVWRRLSDITEHTVNQPVPDVFQHNVYSLVCESYPSANQGHFRPWAVLHMSELTSAFRFVYPILVVAAHDRAFLWDIPSATLIQTLNDCQSVTSGGFNESLGRIKYVEISERHVFLVGLCFLRVFSRATGKSIFDLISSGQCGLWKYVPVSSHRRTHRSALVRYEMVSTQIPYRLRSEDNFRYDTFVSGTSPSLLAGA